MKMINTKNMMENYRARTEAQRRIRSLSDMNTSDAGSTSRHYCEKRLAEEKEKAAAAEAALAEHVKPLEAAIKAAEGRASARTITADRVLLYLDRVDDKFSFAPKKARDGMTIDVDMNAQTFPRAYKYTAESTHFCAVYKAGSWRITEISRDDCRRDSQECIITLPDALKEAILKEYTNPTAF